MVKAVAEFLVGAAVILTPQYQVPLLLGSAAVKVGTSIAKQSKKDETEELQADSNGKSTSQQLTLQWDDLSVAIHSKKSDRLVPIFSNLSGCARPGRQATRLLLCKLISIKTCYLHTEQQHCCFECLQESMYLCTTL